VRCELANGLIEYLRRRCGHLNHAELSMAVIWLVHVDHQLTGRGWQLFPFLGPSSLVFVYMLTRHVVSTEIASIDHLRTVLIACLYVAYAYIGSEISYPLKVAQTVTVDDAYFIFTMFYRLHVRDAILQWRQLGMGLGGDRPPTPKKVKKYFCHSGEKVSDLTFIRMM